jgi:hypothetical protein
MQILIIILFVIAIPFIMAVFLNKEYVVEREIIINKPKQQVFDYLKHLKNHDNFSKWASMDPNMKKKYKGIDGIVGFVSAWESAIKNVGVGEQEIKKITDSYRIDFEIRFIKPVAGKANAYLSTESISKNGTIVIWGFESQMKYPMNLMLLFLNMEKKLGDDLETGLLNLKKILEEKQEIT